MGLGSFVFNKMVGLGCILLAFIIFLVAMMSGNIVSVLLGIFFGFVVFFAGVYYMRQP
jgi:hypothetical protein